MLVPTFDVDPDFGFWFGHETEARLDEVVVVKCRLEAEVLEQGHHDWQSFKLGELVTWNIEYQYILKHFVIICLLCPWRYLEIYTGSVQALTFSIDISISSWGSLLFFYNTWTTTLSKSEWRESDGGTFPDCFGAEAIRIKSERLKND